MRWSGLFCLRCMCVLLLAAGPSLAAAPADAGKRLFFQCAACHNLDAEAPPVFGPHLVGIVGRRAGSVEGFAYQDNGLQQHRLTWDEATLDRWLADPSQVLPGICPSFTGLADAGDRRALIDYLKQPQP